MSLLDDARRLAAELQRDSDNRCLFCGMRDAHRAPCRVQMCDVMPKIVAALEAAERVVDVDSVMWEEAVMDLQLALRDETP